MDPNQVPAFLDKALDLLNNGDIDGFLGLFVDEPAWVSDSIMERAGESEDVGAPGLPSGAGGVIGRSMIADGLGGFRSAFPDLKIALVPATLLTDGRIAAFQFSAEGTNAPTSGNNGWLTNVGRSGRSMSITGSVFVVFDDGRIREMTTHWNCAKALAQLGIRSYARPGPVPK